MTEITYAQMQSQITEKKHSHCLKSLKSLLHRYCVKSLKFCHCLKKLYWLKLQEHTTNRNQWAQVPSVIKSITNGISNHWKTVFSIKT